MITIEDFRIRFPEFSDDVCYSDARIQLFIDDASCFVCVGVYGSKSEMACAYLTAHFLTVANSTASGDTGGGGMITGESADKLSYSAQGLADVNEANLDYSTTSYGRRYLAIRKLVSVGSFIVGSCN